MGGSGPQTAGNTRKQLYNDRMTQVYGYFRPGGHSMTPSRPPDNHCFGGLRFPGRWKGVKNCPHAPGGPSRLLNHPHHAKTKPGLKPGVSLNRRGRPGCAWKHHRGSGMCTGRSCGLLQTAYNQARQAPRVPLAAVGSAPGGRAPNGRIGTHTKRPGAPPTRIAKPGAGI